LAYIGVTAILLEAIFLKGTCLAIHDFEPRLGFLLTLAQGTG
jgi:hypothetical protein